MTEHADARYPQYPQYPPPAPGSRGGGLAKIGRYTLIAGVVIGFLGVLLTVFAAVKGVDWARDMEAGRVDMTGGTVTLQLTQGQERMIYAVTTGSDTSPAPAADCGVTGPSGAVDLTPTSVSIGSDSLQGLHRFTANATGTYTVACSGATDLAVGPPLSGGAIAGGVVSVVAGVLMIGAGVFLFLVGLVLWLVGRARRS